MEYNKRRAEECQNKGYEADEMVGELKKKITILNYGLVDAKKNFDTAKPENKELYQKVINAIEQKIVDATSDWCCARGERAYFYEQRNEYTKLVEEANK